jgi:hypothetical protein
MKSLNELILYSNDQPNSIGERDCLIKPDLHPYLIYRVLKEFFGLPNIVNEDEDKIQWIYLFQIEDLFVQIYDWKVLSCSIVIYSKDKSVQNSEKFANTLNSLLEKEGRKFQKELNFKIKEPFARIIQNPYKLYFSTAENLRDLAVDLISNSHNKSDISNSFQLFQKQFDISRSAFLMYLSSFEGFLNLVYEIYLKPELRDERIYNTINREQIDVKLRLLPTYCEGFKVPIIDKNDERFKNYHRIVNLRNDFVHANLIKSEESQVFIEDDFEFIYLSNSDVQIPKDFSKISIENVDTARKYILDMIDLVFESMKRTYRIDLENQLENEVIQIDILDE